MLSIIMPNAVVLSVVMLSVVVSARVFVSGKPFQPSLIFKSKTLPG
jgi:hypothetical protein